MYKVVKHMEFCYGHRLLGHAGPCRRLHGHNARVEIVLKSEQLDAMGLVIDFHQIKSVVKPWLDDTFDHRVLLFSKDPLVEVLRQAGEEVVVMDENPSAEVICRKIFEYCVSQKLPVHEVIVWETENSCASYS